MKRILFITALITSIAFNAYAAAYKNGDLQIWNTDVEEVKLVNNFKIILEEEFRWYNNVSKFYYQHYDAGLFYDLNKHINIGAGYRQIYELFSSGDPKVARFNNKFMPDYNPYITGTLNWEIAGFKFDDRNKMEFNNLDHKADFWRYRNKLTVKAPWAFTKLEIRPFLSDEVFVVFAGVPSDINQNRLSSGLGMNLVKNVKFDLYYMLQSVKLSVKNPNKWLNANVLGFKLKVAF